jgi:hypothetical protein
MSDPTVGENIVVIGWLIGKNVQVENVAPEVNTRPALQPNYSVTPPALEMVN